ncbi:hypothetical protein PYCC9005_005212 [Savitreella phatthalungensis]
MVPILQLLATALASLLPLSLHASVSTPLGDIRADVDISGDKVPAGLTLEFATMEVDRGSVPVHSILLETASRQTAKKNLTLPIANDGKDIVYFIQFGVGTPPQSMTAVIDTGSHIFWLPGKACKDAACMKHTTFDPSKSSTFVPDNTTWDITYAAGQSSGTVGHDVLQLGSGSTGAKKATFGVADHVDDSFAALASDAVIGLSPRQDSQIGLTFLEGLRQAGSIEKLIFGLDMERGVDYGTQGGRISFGGVDKANDRPDTWALMYNREFWKGDKALWVVAAGMVTVDGGAILKNSEIADDTETYTALIDTGTTMIYLPQEAAVRFHASIRGAVYDTDLQTFIVPCNLSTQVRVWIGHTPIAIDPRDIILAPRSKSRNECYSSVGSTSGMGLGEYEMLLGAAFIKNVHIFFDLEAQQVGLASKIEVTDTKWTGGHGNKFDER